MARSGRESLCSPRGDLGRIEDVEAFPAKIHVFELPNRLELERLASMCGTRAHCTSPRVAVQAVYLLYSARTLSWPWLEYEFRQQRFLAKECSLAQMFGGEGQRLCSFPVQCGSFPAWTCLSSRLQWHHVLMCIGGLSVIYLFIKFNICRRPIPCQ